MAGLFSNPLDWKVTDTLQGQNGGYSLAEAAKFAGYINPITAPATAVGDLLNIGGAVKDGLTTVLGTSTTAPQAGGGGGGGGWGTDDKNDGGGGGGTTAEQKQAAAKAKNIADTNMYLDDKEARLRALLGDINLTRSQGITQLGDSYNTEKQSGEQKYGQQSEDNTRSKINALDAVDTKARTGYNSLRSIIGHSGSANQSAGMVARDAVARQASQDRQKQVDTSAMNERDITNARQMFLNDLEAKRKERESSLLADLLNQENSVYGDLQDLASQRVTNNSGGYEQVRAAIAPLQGEIDSRKSQLQGLFDKYRTPFNAEQKLATLSQFNVDPTAINANAQTGAGDFSPYANFLKRRQQTV